MPTKKIVTASQQAEFSLIVSLFTFKDKEDMSSWWYVIYKKKKSDFNCDVILNKKGAPWNHRHEY